MAVEFADSQVAFARRLAMAARDIGHVLIPVIFTIYVGYFVLLGKSNSGPNVYDHTVLLQALFAVPALACLGWLLIMRRLPGPTPLDWCALALVAAYALAIVTSVNPRVSFEASLFVAIGAEAEAHEQAALANAGAPANKDVLLSTAIVLTEDIADARYYLLKARAARNRDATALLGPTYVPEAGTDSGISSLAPSESAKAPDAIVKMLPRLAKEPVFLPGSAASGRSRTYYSWGALREASVVSLIPGDWITMHSPAAVLTWSVVQEIVY